jgi:hypothetical protein
LDAYEEDIVGKIGRVTGAIGPGQTGEIVVSIRGGSEAFHAYAVDRSNTIAVGTRVIVIEYYPPRSVAVSPA